MPRLDSLPGRPGPPKVDDQLVVNHHGTGSANLIAAGKVLLECRAHPLETGLDHSTDVHRALLQPGLHDGKQP